MVTQDTASRDIGIIGAGRLGSTLALACQAAGYPVRAVAGRDPAGARALSERLDGAALLTAPQVAERVGLLVLAVPDDAVSALAAQLVFRPGQAVVHTSGALGLQALQPAAEAGALRGCLHPLQTFPERLDAPERFHGITCGVEGDGELGSQLADLATALGARVLRLEGVDRAGYHAAAVFASNYLVALHAAAAEAFALAGLPAEAAASALSPLTTRAADNVARMPLAQALTGPLARGDLSTLERHLHLLEASPELASLYRALARQLLSLPLPLPEGTRTALQRLLSP
jgi:predicted short-subunit dehydrogenase-like oxidoreductase (DUF2520 family)